MERSFLDLPDALIAHAEHGGDLLERMLALACHDQRAVTRRLQPMLSVAALLEVVAALGLTARFGRLPVAALSNHGEEAPPLFRRLGAVGPRSAHTSI
jgi:hypothetical protein